MMSGEKNERPGKDFALEAAFNSPRGEVGGDGVFFFFFLEGGVLLLSIH